MSQGRFIVGLLMLGALSPWAFGQGWSQEKFVPGDTFRPVMLEIRSEATIHGAEVKLRQVARWAGRDNLTMEPAADLTVVKLAAGKPAQWVGLEEIKSALEGAGMNVGIINFSGATSCKVIRSDAGQASASPQIIEALRAQLPASTQPAGYSSTPVLLGEGGAVVPPTQRTLREILTDELSERFGLPADALQVKFNAQDEKLAGLSEPQFRFEVEPRRQRNIGDITWDVTIAAGGQKQKASITARVRAWQAQLVATRFIAFKQVLGAEDVAERRVLVDSLSEQGSLKKEQVVGQQAARDIAAGTVLSGRMIEAIQVVRLGELMTVTVEVSGVQIKWVAEAREHGAVGQTIRVRKPGTREEFFVSITGPQEGRLIGSGQAKVAAR